MYNLLIVEDEEMMRSYLVPVRKHHIFRKAAKKIQPEKVKSKSKMIKILVWGGFA
ncbi:MAG: hypothetical protein HQ557_14085, partial [Bacteroidetes bacterium]|nr:hypothetical protein [Bacteroidota bacterium]